MQSSLDIPSATLSARLSELVDVGFIERTSYDEIPPRVEYTATPKLGDLKPMRDHLVTWVGRHDLHGTDPTD